MNVQEIPKVDIMDVNFSYPKLYKFTFAKMLRLLSIVQAEASSEVAAAVNQTGHCGIQ